MAKERVRILGSTGDADALSYGGGVVYATPGSVTWEWWEGPIGPNGEEIDYSPDYVYTIYRAEIPADVFKYYNWIKVADVARSIGADPVDLLAQGRSRTIMDRVWALEAAVGYYGPHEFDQYPVQFRGTELRRRWSRFWNRKCR